ncbi:MAG TPA: hypothetical protein QGF58_21875 [Myxococcota bacterium]|nr:hypothetical protein [Myxococcota bacterium]
MDERALRTTETEQLRARIAGVPDALVEAARVIGLERWEEHKLDDDLLLVLEGSGRHLGIGFGRTVGADRLVFDTAIAGPTTHRSQLFRASDRTSAIRVPVGDPAPIELFGAIAEELQR